MVKRAKCRKCVNCEYEDYESLYIGCKILGHCREKYSCEHFMTELDYKTALESLKLIEEMKKWKKSNKNN